MATSKLPLRLALAVAVALLLVFGLWRTFEDRDNLDLHPDARGEVAPGRPQPARSSRTPPTSSIAGSDASASPPAPAASTPNPVHAALPFAASEDPSAHGALSGRVINWSTREGVAGAELSLVHGGVSHSTITKADGSYRFEAPAPGTWTLATLSAEGFLPYAPEPGSGAVSFEARPQLGVAHADLYLYPALRYSGLVLDEQGEALAGADIELFGAASGERALVSIEERFRSDAEGRFEFSAPDLALLEARHPDHAPGRARLDEAAQLSHALTITMGSGLATASEPIRGRLIDHAGVGLAQVEVVALPTAEEDTAREGRALTEADGSFSLGPLDASRYTLLALPPGQPRIERAGVEAGDWVELRAAAGLELRGQLVDSAGAPVPGGTVVLNRVEGPGRQLVSARSFFDPSGQFAFHGLAPGSYELEGASQGHARSEALRVELGPEPGPLVRLGLREGASVFGAIVDGASGDPLRFAQVSARGVFAPSSLLPGASSTVTDATGAFELRAVEPGRVSLTAVAFSHDARVLSGIELEPGERHGPLRIELQPIEAGEKAKTEIAGIGVAIGPAEQAVAITKVIEGGGAAAAGIVAGEALVAVEGESVAELGFEAAVEAIRGPAGSIVNVELERLDGTRETLKVERRVISF